MSRPTERASTTTISGGHASVPGDPSAPPTTVETAGSCALWWRSAVDGHVEWLVSDIQSVIGTTGHPREDWLHDIHPDDREKLLSFGSGLAEIVLVFRGVRQDGSTRWLRSRVVGPQERNGEAGWIGIVEDVTEQQGVSSDDREAERRFGALAASLMQATLDSYHEVVHRCLADLGDLVGADRSYVFRVRDEHISNTDEWCAPGVQPMQQLLQDLPASEFTWVLEQLAAGSAFVASVDDLPPEAAAERASFIEQGIQSLVLVPMLANGTLVGFVGFDSVRDRRSWRVAQIAVLERFVTLLVAADRRMRTLRRIANAEALAEGFGQHSDAVMILFSPTMDRVLYANPAFEHLYGIAPSHWSTDAAELTFTSILPADLPSVLALSDSATRRRTASPPLDFRVRDAEGATRWLRGTMFPIHAPDGELLAVGGIGTDVTTVYQLVEALTDARDAAEAASETKSRFLARAGHELRTPLNAVVGFSELLASATDEAERNEYLERVTTAAAHLLQITDDLLVVLQAEATTRAEPAPSNFSEILAQCVAVVEPLAQANGVRIEVDNRLDRPVRRADLLRQIIVNLLSNAAKYNRRGGEAVVRASSDSGQVVIEVADTGIGIAHEDQQRMFAPFERLGAERTDQPGTGLGLAIVKRAVESLGGTIEVRSRPGGGTTVTVSVPALAELRPIVVIEDDDASRRLFEIFLRRVPNPVHLFGDGRSALEALDTTGPVDGVVVDWNLPDTTGDELIPRLRSHAATADARIVVVTAAAADEYRVSAERSGADAFLTKPVRVDELLGALRRVDTPAG
jgi:PAS domain S-box-containing protein